MSVKKTLIILCVCIGGSLLSGSPFRYMAPKPSIQLSQLMGLGSFKEAVVLNAQLLDKHHYILVVKGPQIDEKKALIHKLAGHLNIPTREIEHGMSSVRNYLSADTSLLNLSFKASAILEWDEIGVQAKLANISHAEARLVVSNKYQGLVIRREGERCTVTLELKPDRVQYQAQIPIEQISVASILEGLNVTNLVAGW